MKDIKQINFNESIGEQLNVILDNINSNFKAIASSDFLRGKDGDNTYIEEIELMGFNPNIITPSLSYPNLYIDSEQVSIEDITQLIGKTISENMTKNNLKEVGGKQWYDNIEGTKIYLICKNGKVISSLPYIYIDSRFKNLSENGANNPLEFDGVIDLSCVIYFDGEKFIKTQPFPTLQYDNERTTGSGFVWKINGEVTGIDAAGPKGKDGKDGQLYFVKAKLDENNSYYKIGQVAKINQDGNIKNSNYTIVWEDINDSHQIKTGDIIITTYNSLEGNQLLAIALVERLELNDKEVEYKLYMDDSTSIQHSFDMEAFKNLLNDIKYSNDELKGIFLPIIDSANKKIGEGGFNILDDETLRIGLYDNTGFSYGGHIQLTEKNIVVEGNQPTEIIGGLQVDLIETGELKSDLIETGNIKLQNISLHDAQSTPIMEITSLNRNDIFSHRLTQYNENPSYMEFITKFTAKKIKSFKWISTSPDNNIIMQDTNYMVLNSFQCIDPNYSGLNTTSIYPYAYLSSPMTIIIQNGLEKTYHKGIPFIIEYGNPREKRIYFLEIISNALGGLNSLWNDFLQGKEITLDVNNRGCLYFLDPEKFDNNIDITKTFLLQYTNLTSEILDHGTIQATCENQTYYIDELYYHTHFINNENKNVDGYISLWRKEGDDDLNKRYWSNLLSTNHFNNVIPNNNEINLYDVSNLDKWNSGMVQNLSFFSCIPLNIQREDYETAYYDYTWDKPLNLRPYHFIQKGLISNLQFIIPEFISNYPTLNLIDFGSYNSSFKDINFRCENFYINGKNIENYFDYLRTYIINLETQVIKLQGNVKILESQLSSQSN